MIEAKASIEQGRRCKRPGIAGSGLLLDGMNISVAISARGAWDVRFIVLQILTLAEAEERGHLVIDLIVQLGVVLIAVIADQQKSFVIVRPAGAVRSRQRVEHLRCKGIELGDGNQAAGRVNGVRQRVHYRDGQDSAAIFEVGDGVEVEIALKLTEALVIGEEEQLIFDEWTADGEAKLIALERGFLEYGGTEGETDGVQAGIAQKFVSSAMKLVGSGT